MNVQKTVLAAAVLFALAACQPEPDATAANAASVDDPMLMQEDDDDRDDDYDDNDGDADGDEGDADPDEDDDDDDSDPDDTDAVVSSPAEATEHADEAADDALLDTREGGNPLVNSPIAPVDPIVQEEEGEPEDDDDGE